LPKNSLHRLPVSAISEIARGSYHDDDDHNNNNNNNNNNGDNESSIKGICKTLDFDVPGEPSPSPHRHVTAESEMTEDSYQVSKIAIRHQDDFADFAKGISIEEIGERTSLIEMEEESNAQDLVLLPLVDSPEESSSPPEQELYASHAPIVEGHVESDSQVESSSSSPDQTNPDTSFESEGDVTVITKNQHPEATVEVENYSQAQVDLFSVFGNDSNQIEKFADAKQMMDELLDVFSDYSETQHRHLVLISQAGMPEEPSSPEVEELDDQAPEHHHSLPAPVVEGHVESDSQEESSSSSPDGSIPEDSFESEGEVTVIIKDNISQAQEDPFVVPEKDSNEIEEFADAKQMIEELLDVNADEENDSDDRETETEDLVMISQAEMLEEPSSLQVEELDDQAPEHNEYSHATVVEGHVQLDSQEESSSSSPERTIPEDSFESEVDVTVMTKDQDPKATVEVGDDSQHQDEPFAVSGYDSDESDELADEKRMMEELLDVNADEENDSDEFDESADEEEMMDELLDVNSEDMTPVNVEVRESSRLEAETRLAAADHLPSIERMKANSRARRSSRVMNLVKDDPRTTTKALTASKTANTHETKAAPTAAAEETATVGVEEARPIDETEERREGTDWTLTFGPSRIVKKGERISRKQMTEGGLTAASTEQTPTRCSTAANCGSQENSAANSRSGRRVRVKSRVQSLLSKRRELVR
jgi:hypothetical protein